MFRKYLAMLKTFCAMKTHHTLQTLYLNDIISRVERVVDFNFTVPEKVIVSKSSHAYFHFIVHLIGISISMICLFVMFFVYFCSINIVFIKKKQKKFNT